MKIIQGIDDMVVQSFFGNRKLIDKILPAEMLKDFLLVLLIHSLDVIKKNNVGILLADGVTRRKNLEITLLGLRHVLYQLM